MQNETSFGKGIFSVVKGTALALATSLLFSILFACVLRFTNWSDKIVYPVNQTVKVLSVVLGVFLFVRGEKGWLKGGGIALLFTALSYLAFSAIGGVFSLSWLIFVELGFTVGVGVLSGILAVNIRV
ncbi:MAG: TIGR04086 family membrane protein [Clostridia bacterium]|nr:TIGR04086 family membrane protein [Clostridia bacterium]